MDDKELYDMLYSYAESTRTDMDIAFAKLYKIQDEEIRKAKLRAKRRRILKPIFAVVSFICIVGIVLGITLPITLNNNPQTGNQTFYCNNEDIVYELNSDLNYIISTYSFNAKIPQIENANVDLIGSNTYSDFHGAQISYNISEGISVFVKLIILPKQYILDIYNDYFTMQSESQWGDYQIRSSNSINEDTFISTLKLYFTDGKYDYFIDAESIGELTPTALLDLLYK